VDGGEGTGALDELDELSLVVQWPRKGPAKAERKVRGWPAESTLRTGAPAEVARREEAGARRIAARGEGEERLCTKHEREREGGAPAEAAAREREGRESLLVSSLVLRGETPTSEGGREEDEKFCEPMGREGKKFLEKRVIRERGLAGGKVRG
jgi:hypothetical protein